jgi:signal transduction histidine kinase
MFSVATNSDRIVKIINSVRAFSRTNEELPYEKVEVSDLIQGTFDLCRENLKSNSIEVRFDFKVPEKQIIDCRISQIEQVIFGLILNSIDALKTLDEKWIELKVEETPPGRLQIRFTDSGKGIPELLRERVFQPFFTTKAPGVGTGLGLSVAHNLIRQHQGVISLDLRHPNTSFVVELPLRRERKTP